MKRSNPFLDPSPKRSLLFSLPSPSSAFEIKEDKNDPFEVKDKREREGEFIQLATPPTTPTKPKSVYSHAKAMFQRGCPKPNHENGCLIGRELEALDISDFFTKNIKNKTCNCLYLTGPPGSGKSEQLDLTLKHHHTLFSRSKIIKINCMVLLNPQEIFQKILMEMGQPATNTSTSEDLYQVLKEGKDVLVVILLDEIDSLLTKNQQILINLFKLSNKALSPNFNTKCLLVGISNSLDLTNTLLPKLFKYDINPKVVNFSAYTFDKMKLILVGKLHGLLDGNKENVPPGLDPADPALAKTGLVPAKKETPIVSMSAILLCCKKTASTTGDLRKCFDLIYKSIELVEAEQRQSTASFNLITAPKVSINHIAKVCNINYGNSILTKLTYLQQLILVHLMNLEELGSAITVNAFYDYWLKHNQNLVKKSEFLELLPNLEALSVITLTTRKAVTVIRSNVNYQEVKRSLPQKLQLLLKHTEI